MLFFAAWALRRLLSQDHLQDVEPRGRAHRRAAAREDALRMTDLAEELKTSRGRVSQAISRLEERGWVRRETDENDRRGQLAVLTEQGF